MEETFYLQYSPDTLACYQSNVYVQMELFEEHPEVLFQLESLGRSAMEMRAPHSLASVTLSTILNGFPVKNLRDMGHSLFQYSATDSKIMKTGNENIVTLKWKQCGITQWQ